MADLPHEIPWYFGVVLVALWAALTLGIVRVAWQLRARRRERAAERVPRPPRRLSLPPPPDDTGRR